MRAFVPLQFVGARELLATVHPVADEGPLARVPPQMRAQVRRLAVRLVAARHVADVHLAPVLLAPVGGEQTLVYCLGHITRVNGVMGDGLYGWSIKHILWIFYNSEQCDEHVHCQLDFTRI